VPVHYNTFPPIEVDASRFKSLVDDMGVACSLMEPGAVLDF